jgi:hypothetical protein
MRRLWTILELAVMLFFLFRVLWTDGRAHTHARALGIIWVVATSLLDTHLKLFSKKDLGLTWAQSRRTDWMLDLGFLIVVCIWITGLVFGTARHVPFDEFLFRRAGYLFWALVQQYLTESYLFRRLQWLGGDMLAQISTYTCLRIGART